MAHWFQLIFLFRIRVGNSPRAYKRLPRHISAYANWWWCKLSVHRYALYGSPFFLGKFCLPTIEVDLSPKRWSRKHIGFCSRRIIADVRTFRHHILTQKFAEIGRRTVLYGLYGGNWASTALPEYSLYSACDRYPAFSIWARTTLRRAVQRSG